MIHSAALATDWGPLELFIQANYDATVRPPRGRARGRAAGPSSTSAPPSSTASAPTSTPPSAGPTTRSSIPTRSRRSWPRNTSSRGTPQASGRPRSGPATSTAPGDHMSTYQMFDAIMDGIFGYIGSGALPHLPDLRRRPLRRRPGSARSRRARQARPSLLTDGQKVAWKDYVRVMFAAVGSKKRPIEHCPRAWPTRRPGS